VKADLIASTLDRASFSHSDLVRVSFLDNRMRRLRMDDVVLSHCLFGGCDLRDATFTGAALESVAINRCQVYRVRLTPDQARELRTTNNDFSELGDGSAIRDGALGFTQGD
jgi:uncharacterized protein YjbI with pentapeptide repeats